MRASRRVRRSPVVSGTGGLPQGGNGAQTREDRLAQGGRLEDQDGGPVGGDLGGEGEVVVGLHDDDVASVALAALLDGAGTQRGATLGQHREDGARAAAAGEDR